MGGIFLNKAILFSVLFFIAMTPLLLPAPGRAQPPGEEQAEQEEFLIGLIPEENIFRQVKRYKALEAYLTEKMGVKVRFSILSRYSDIIDRFTQRDMDGAVFGTFTAALAHERLGVEPVARLVNLDGSAAAEGCLFVRKDSGLRGAGDLRGRKAAFVDMATATGYIFAIAYLRENGISSPSSYFSEINFTGSHETSVYAVLSGRSDVGAAKCRMLKKLGATDPLIEDELLVIAKSEELPDNTLCVRPDIDPELKKKLSSALLKMHTEARGKEVLQRLEALKFVPSGWGEFEPVRRLSEKAGIDIKRYNYR